MPPGGCRRGTPRHGSSSRACANLPCTSTRTQNTESPACLASPMLDRLWVWTPVGRPRHRTLALRWRWAALSTAAPQRPVVSCLPGCMLQPVRALLPCSYNKLPPACCSTCSGGRSTNSVQPRLTGAAWPCCADVTVISGSGSRPGEEGRGSTGPQGGCSQSGRPGASDPHLPRRMQPQHWAAAAAAVRAPRQQQASCLPSPLLKLPRPPTNVVRSRLPSDRGGAVR